VVITNQARRVLKKELRKNRHLRKKGSFGRICRKTASLEVEAIICNSRASGNFCLSDLEVYTRGQWDFL
jgi:hypothetical protein